MVIKILKQVQRKSNSSGAFNYFFAFKILIYRYISTIPFIGFESHQDNATLIL